VLCIVNQSYEWWRRTKAGGTEASRSDNQASTQEPRVYQQEILAESLETLHHQRQTNHENVPKQAANTE